MANFAEYVEVQTGSWAFEHENQSALAQSSKPTVFSSVSEVDLPEEITPEAWTPIEDQANQGACRGHSLSTNIENLVVRQGGDPVQLSRACAYYMTQRIDRISGDRGSTIEGGCRLVSEDEQECEGLCLESEWKYPSRYDNRIPSTWASAVRYKSGGWVMIKNTSECRKHVATVGGVDIGIIWGDEIDRQVSRNGIIETYTGRGGGGHAISVLSYRITDYNGNPLSEPYPEIWNSWSLRWGYKGRCLVAPRAFDAMCQHRYNVMVGHLPSKNPYPGYKRPSYGPTVAG